MRRIIADWMCDNECPNAGTTYDESELPEHWLEVATDRPMEYHHYHFCSEECFSEWKTHQPEGAVAWVKRKKAYQVMAREDDE